MIIEWSVMRYSVRFSDGLTPKVGAACAVRLGRGSDARFRSGDWVRGPPRGAAGDHALRREKAAADHPRGGTPEAKVPSFQRVPKLHCNVAVADVRSS